MKRGDLGFTFEPQQRTRPSLEAQPATAPIATFVELGMSSFTGVRSIVVAAVGLRRNGPVPQHYAAPVSSSAHV